MSKKKKNYARQLKRLEELIYTPVDDEISVNACLVQTTLALDVAANIAQQSGDVRGLTEVAAGWTSVAQALFMQAQPPQGDRQPKELPRFGFSVDEED